MLKFLKSCCSKVCSTLLLKVWFEASSTAWELSGHSNSQALTQTQTRSTESESAASQDSQVIPKHEQLYKWGGLWG